MSNQESVGKKKGFISPHVLSGANRNFFVDFNPEEVIIIVSLRNQDKGGL